MQGFLISGNSQKSHGVGLGYVERMEWFRCLISPKIWQQCVQHVASIVAMQKNFFDFFVKAVFFMQDFLVVHCCNGVALMYNVPIQEALFKKKSIIITFPALHTTLLFFWDWRCQSFPLWTLLLWFWATMKHLGFIRSYHIAKFSLSLLLKPHA